MGKRFIFAGVAALVAAAILPAYASSRTASIAALPDCLGKPVVRPTSVVFACGDGGVYATGVRWSNWGAPFATATATIHENDCTPNCAQGHFHTYAAYLAVTGRERCHSGQIAYGKQSFVRRTKGLPTSRTRLDWFDLPCH
jgi:hypothetical protein